MSDREKQIYIKAALCVFGLLVLILCLVLGGKRAIPEPSQPEATEESSMPEPVTEILYNIWLMEADDKKVIVCCDDEIRSFSYAEGFVPDAPKQEKVADIVLTDGKVSFLKEKEQLINGRILRAGTDGIEVEGMGVLPLDENCRGYRLYGGLTALTPSEICIGYDFTDLVVEEGKVCAFLAVREEAMESIRVLIKAGNYAGMFHESVLLTSDSDFTLDFYENGERKEEHFAAGETLCFLQDSPYLAGGRVKITPDVLTGKVILKECKRKQEEPAYRGTMELALTKSGIVVVNEVPLEEYLYSVVPSEMPSSYPEEALKSQAICARTYAYGHMQRAGLAKYGAHVDDSATYQVYNNIKTSAATNKAVNDTYGQILVTADGRLAETFYYSTSCGVGSDATVWKTKKALEIDYIHAKGIAPDAQTDLAVQLQDEETFQTYIHTVNPSDYEKEESWYRWTYEAAKPDADRILELLKGCYETNDAHVLTLEKGAYVSRKPGKIGKIKDLQIVHRGPGGVADELLIVGTKATYKVLTQGNIRKVLCDGETKIKLQNKKTVDCPNLLPSAFFTIEACVEDKIVTEYKLTGGGYGHGAGMSQNASKGMAKAGYTAMDIVRFFYDGCEVKNLYEQKDEQKEEGTGDAIVSKLD